VFNKRLEIRIDAEIDRKLNELSSRRGVGGAQVVRDLIDAAHREIDRARRLAAVEDIARAEVEDVPDPDELRRQMSAKYADAGLP
jgi:predicted DNA-binding protein